jgi:hypothetical protein
MQPSGVDRRPGLVGLQAAVVVGHGGGGHRGGQALAQPCGVHPGGLPRGGQGLRRSGGGAQAAGVPGGGQQVGVGFGGRFVQGARVAVLSGSGGLEEEEAQGLGEHPGDVGEAAFPAADTRRINAAKVSLYCCMLLQQ